ncbi:spherulation-specific family 4 protein [Selenomonas sp. F0473]|uniref:spherulation-specific family 4 protein n=1 Tax=Selenomonas sp. F0473 TaxID=999423 RepID=UPI00029E2B71|nr:spherulation-specific family 4 protein [Selenomonas sp. F0473]EKU70794.1 outer membrane autotransporter barrel domain-containing protein [Selenomonas sp. F0473]
MKRNRLAAMIAAAVIIGVVSPVLAARGTQAPKEAVGHEARDEADRIQINFEYLRGFSRKPDDVFDVPVRNQSVIMPAFRWTSHMNPGASFWDGITSVGGGLVPYVAFGSYVGADPVLVRRNEDAEQMQKNHAAGIKNIGYTYTRQSTRDLNKVYSDIDNFVNFYGRENISGYFIDEVMRGNTQAQVDYIKSIYDYVKSKYPEKIVIANCGGEIRDAVAPYADIWLTREVTADFYLNHNPPSTSEFTKNPANADRNFHVIHTTSPEQYEEVLRLSRERNAGWLFITSDTNAYPSGYDDLPTYFEDLMMTINHFTPTRGSLFTRSHGAGAPKPTIEMPRSKVDLDLMRAVRGRGYRSLEKTRDGQLKIDIGYLRRYGGDYSDKSSNIKYHTRSSGVMVNASKDFGKFAAGAIFGYQKSDVDYREKYGGVHEKVTSYQFGFSGKYDLKKDADITGQLIYSTNQHKFRTNNGLGAIAGAEYRSRILDLNARLGRKLFFRHGYIKPYVGAGLTRVQEGAIGKLNVSGASRNALNGSVGVYGEKNFGKLLVFGDFEYEHRFGGGSYHGVRDYAGRYDVAPLDYARGVFNFAVGARYSVSDLFQIETSYERQESKNKLLRVELSAQF